MASVMANITINLWYLYPYLNHNTWTETWRKFTVEQEQNLFPKYRLIKVLKDTLSHQSGRSCFWAVAKCVYWLRWTSWHFTNNYTLSEPVSQWDHHSNPRDSPQSNMEDELVLICVLLKKKLENRIKLLNYMTFIASRYLTTVYLDFSLKNKILKVVFSPKSANVDFSLFVYIHRSS